MNRRDCHIPSVYCDIALLSSQPLLVLAVSALDCGALSNKFECPQNGRVPRLSSGIFHALGVYFVTVTQPMTYSVSTSPLTRPNWHKVAYFFYAQAIAITIEDFFCWASRTFTDGEIKIPSFRWVIGVSYTFVWFPFTTTLLWVHPQLAAFGYQRAIDQGKGYIHVLDATSKVSSVIPLNPWPAIVDRALFLVNTVL
ncbi:hypothetical protein AA313_de0203746 [Arthrobotrys entomopaga]|nr:hypothetical protein AA313_de0203746 [Arthrobotrys entomopaga]